MSVAAAARRAVTVPTVVLTETLLLVTAPLSLAVAALVAAVTRSSRPLRSTALVLAYALLELITLWRVLRGVRSWTDLLHQVLHRAYRVLERVLDVHVVLEDGSVPPERLRRTSGLIVLARHCGPGDSLFIAWLLVAHHHLQLRIVLTALLRIEPLVDMAGDHLPLCFVGRDRQRARRRVGALAATMTSGDALLLFPEGGNFSRPRWRRAVLELSASGAFRAARRARHRTHTLPPRRGGALAALKAAPAADVLLLAHSGLADDGRNRPWWRVPTHRTLLVRTVLAPAATVPRNQEGLTAWLDTAWAGIDSWVATRTG